jgi:hypothetical protein
MCGALPLALKGRNSHQPVNAALRLEIAKRILAGGGKGDAFDPRLVAGLKIDNTGFEPFCLHPSQVHAEQHLRPVLGLGAAGTGVDGDDGIVPIVVAVQHHIQGELVHPTTQIADLAGHFRHRIGIRLFGTASSRRIPASSRSFSRP